MLQLHLTFGSQLDCSQHVELPLGAWLAPEKRTLQVKGGVCNCLRAGADLKEDVVGVDGDGVGVQHEALGQQAEQVVGTHGLLLASAHKEKLYSAFVSCYLSAFLHRRESP